VKIANATLIDKVGAKITKTNPAIKATGEVPRCSQPRINGAGPTTGSFIVFTLYFGLRSH